MSAIYPKYKEALLGAASNVSLLTETVKCALVDTGTYTYSASHEFYSDISGVVGTPATIGATKSVTSGVFDGGDCTFTSVSGATVEALVIYIDTGVAGTSRLVAFIDSGVTGLPVTPNGGDVTVAWDSGANKIFTL
jgi:hypothetical protein